MARFVGTSDLVKCSFCGKSHKQVDKLIAGPGVYICNECIELCNDIIIIEGPGGPGGAESPEVPRSDDQRRWREAQRALVGRLGRQPTVSELAAELGWTEERLTTVRRGAWAALTRAAASPTDVAGELRGLQRQLERLARRVAGLVGQSRDGDPGETVIASGSFEGGIAWIIDAGGDDEQYWTGLRLAYTHGGGMAGPKLWGDELINVYTGRDDDGPLGIAVRAEPRVVGVELVDLGGAARPLVACGGGVIDGLRFYVGLAWAAPPEAEQAGTFGLRELRARDQAGGVVATYDLTFWDRKD